MAEINPYSFPVCVVRPKLKQLGVMPYDDHEFLQHIFYMKGKRCLKTKYRSQALQRRLDFLKAQMDAIYSMTGREYQLSLEDIASFCGVSRERIRQIETIGKKELYKKRKELLESVEHLGFKGISYLSSLEK